MQQGCVVDGAGLKGGVMEGKKAEGGIMQSAFFCGPEIMRSADRINPPPLKEPTE